MPRRLATHANSWYVADPRKLDAQLNAWITAVKADECGMTKLPIPNARVIMAPHAGYSYSGATAGFSYAAWDLSKATRIFILGPAHHVYINGCSISGCNAFDTPLGELLPDSEVLQKLEDTGKFSRITLKADEDEHSIEMHLPFIFKAIEFAEKFPKDVKIVPIIVGSITTTQEKTYGALLKPYLEDPQNAFVISTDFCHWGPRFSYTGYFPELPSHDNPNAELVFLNETGHQVIKHPLYKSIRALDHQGMSAISTGKHSEFAAYLEKTRNTVCGRHPIGVIMAAAELMFGENKGSSFGRFRYLNYAQSEELNDINGSSVSYVSGFMEMP
ncbi:UPF0103-domain-containing protein [Choiromyces venosus 120613-1]|uniref:UPF0103-domain-containing protein n=1 Tax=Choiromyces venosus 120613-1 TaxID=1336337 RepID=A0A3N4J2N9_9PEZI|nr:UPF0103-domain-containing protein [Choiromyces venosus 120613-1]